MSPVDPSKPSLFGAAAPESPGEIARALAQAATPGHFDELRGAARAGGALAPHWQAFFDAPGLAPV